MVSEAFSSPRRLDPQAWGCPLDLLRFVLVHKVHLPKEAPCPTRIAYLPTPLPCGPVSCRIRWSALETNLLRFATTGPRLWGLYRLDHLRSSSR
jgi:hypothetical protein